MESDTILNKNQDDYYRHCWDACKKGHDVYIDSYGFSFNTLWFNFLQKFLNEVMISSGSFGRITIRLVSTRKGINCFKSIIDYYKSLPIDYRKKIEIYLVEIDETSYFTGICINRDFLSLSMREPHKLNEHMREWSRTDSDSSCKMLDWLCGIMDYHFEDIFSCNLVQLN